MVVYSRSNINITSAWAVDRESYRKSYRKIPQIGRKHIKKRFLHYMALGRAWYRAKYSYKVWERFARQASPILRISFFGEKLEIVQEIMQEIPTPPIPQYFPIGNIPQNRQETYKKTILALYGTWEGLVQGKILIQGVGTICPPGKPYSEDVICL